VFKVTRRVPYLSVSETKIFESKEEPRNNLKIGYNRLLHFNFNILIKFGFL